MIRYTGWRDDRSISLFDTFNEHKEEGPMILLVGLPVTGEGLGVSFSRKEEFLEFTRLTDCGSDAPVLQSGPTTRAPR